MVGISSNSFLLSGLKTLAGPRGYRRGKFQKWL